MRCETNIDHGLGKLVEGFSRSLSPDWQQLSQSVYERIQNMAYRVVGHSDSSVSFGPTTLTHEAFIRFVDRNALANVRDVEHFFSLFAVIIKQVFADHHRKKNTWKGGGRSNLISLDAALHSLESSCKTDYGQLDDCLTQLATEYPRQAKALNLQVFTVLEVREIAAALGVSKSTVESDLRFAKAYVRRLLSE